MGDVGISSVFWNKAASRGSQQMQRKAMCDMAITAQETNFSPCRSYVNTLRTAQEIENVRKFWSSSPGSLSSDIAHFLPHCQGNPNHSATRVFVLYRGGEPGALLAGVLKRERFAFRFGWLNLLKPNVNVLTIRGGMRGDQSRESCLELVRAVIRCMKNGEADLTLLTDVNVDSSLYQYVRREPGILFRDHLVRHRPHRKRQLPATVEAFHAELSSHVKKRYRQIAKRLSAAFSAQVRLACYTNLDRLDRCLADVEMVAKTTWQGAMGRALDITPSQLKNFKTFAQNGWLRVYILYLAEKPCAFWVGNVYRGVFVSQYTGYDPAYATYSLGTYLLLRIMEQLCLEHVEAFDFGGSDEDYKKRFASTTWYEADMHIFAPSRLGMALAMMRLITVVPHESARSLLQYTSGIQRMKKAWRKVSINRTQSVRVDASQD